jgi:hypothetical protein
LLLSLSFLFGNARVRAYDRPDAPVVIGREMVRTTHLSRLPPPIGGLIKKRSAVFFTHRSLETSFPNLHSLPNSNSALHRYRTPAALSTLAGRPPSSISTSPEHRRPPPPSPPQFIDHRTASVCRAHPTASITLRQHLGPGAVTNRPPPLFPLHSARSTSSLSDYIQRCRRDQAGGAVMRHPGGARTLAPT